MLEDDQLNKGQFLLTKSDVLISQTWGHLKFEGYTLFYHPELSICEGTFNTNNCVILGEIYYWKNPEYTNQDILKSLVKARTKEELITLSNDFCGDYVILAKIGSELILVNDACAQSEVYHTKNYTSFATQINLLNRAEALSVDTTLGVMDYYQSNIFKKSQLHIGQSTEYENVKHLLPNHFIHISEKRTTRFFPTFKLEPLTLKKSAEKACKMLRGFTKAISLRGDLALGVTAGIDSRVLFLASLDLDVRYYTSQFDFMKSDHYDITVAKKLTSIYNRELEIIPEVSSNELEESEYQLAKSNFEKSMDHPRTGYFNKIFNSNKSLANTISINGNISEIARNYYGYNTKADGKVLQALEGLQSSKHAQEEYASWVKELQEVNENIELLDLFYWEERMGNWAAKAKTESKALGRQVVSPFNSRTLLSTLLRSERKYRDSHFSKLYTEMIKVLSNHNKEVLNLPVNPSKKQFVIKTLKRLKVYNTYQKIRVALSK